MASSFCFTDPVECLSLLGQRLAEPAPGRIQLLTGPRQVGKTTTLLRIAERLGPTATYAALDAPEAALAGYWDRLWSQAASTASRAGKAVLLLDEVQHLEDWSGRLKTQWDRLRRKQVPVHIVATGSSALRLGAGSKESLAGRFERLVLAHWSARALGTAFDLAAPKAADVVVRFGSYPGSIPYADDKARWSAYLRDAIIEPAIGRDILALSQVRKPALLRQVFAAAISSPAQIVSLQKLQGQLQDRGALETVAHYLDVLEDAYLVAPVQKYSSRPLRRRASPPKLVVLNNGLLSAADPRGAPDQTSEPERFGAWVENACLAFAWNAGQQIAYWRQEPFEVDGVVTGEWGRWAIEVKTGDLRARDLSGLLAFVKRYPSFSPLVVTGDRGSDAAATVNVPTMRWDRFLFEGPPRG
jgi:hypothetical protein